MQIYYFGWSGIALKGNQTLIFCLTHGHPEHAGSFRAFLEAPEARAYLPHIHLISSPDVIRHVNRHGVLAPGNVHSVSDGESLMMQR